jgi:hypothetical protein
MRRRTVNVAGACHCGKVAYEAIAYPEHVSICHCTNCQRLITVQEPV